VIPEVVIGLDVGSTTVKAVALDAHTKTVRWRDYQRHETKQPEKCRELLQAAIAAIGDVPSHAVRILVTGSGAGPLSKPLGARFVQEVNAVTMAVEGLHPDVGSVIELGGQDAKIIMFRQPSATGDRTVTASMNDKCASGTGATIDKCLLKVGLPSEALAKIEFDATRLHHVAAKCGVFAETDIVNLVKTGIPANEIMCSLADAIVHQNLSVLTRGNTLRHRVLLLGGPNTYLPFLQACWRLRIPETWADRGYDFPRDVPLEETIFVPDGAQYYAALGAAFYGLREPELVAPFPGLDGLEAFIQHGRADRLGAAAGPPLVRSADELTRFRAAYMIPPFREATFEPGQVVRAAIGLDGGSTSSKAVLLAPDGTLLLKAYALSKGNPIQDAKDLLANLRDRVHAQGASLDVVGFGATGYAADVLNECLNSDVTIVETVAHMMSAVRYFDDVDVVCDIGGQDIKVLFLEHGRVKSFRLSNQCSAGNGTLLQAMAEQFGIPITEYADTAFAAELAPQFSYGCAVFLDSDRVNFQKEGFSSAELLSGLAQVLPKNIWQYVVQVPRLAALGRTFVLQGGTQYNLAAVKAQVDYIQSRVPNARVVVHPHAGEAGAIGAGLETLRVIERLGRSRFIGLDAAIGLRYQARRDASTTCHFCANHCSRTFIDAERPDGSTSRYISGFSCEKGTVESKDAMVRIVAERKAALDRAPNLVTYEARRAFQHVADAPPLPDAGSPVADIKVSRTIFGGVRRRSYHRGFERSSPESAQRRARWRVGIPRVLNMYSTAPFWRAYFETLGVDSRHVVFSDPTTEEMWHEGGKYGSIDPCYPAKVPQAHIHDLLFHKHAKNPLDAIFFPIFSHVPSFVTDAKDAAACPIVAGTPEVMKAAFTKEQDLFGTRGISYLAPAFTFAEPTMLRRQLFEAFGPVLNVTEDESDFACAEAHAALAAFEADVEARGRAVLEQVEMQGKIAILMIGRPYHSDPGLNHAIPDEFQALGYPILSVRSIPKDPKWLERFFGEDIAAGRIRSPLDISDVWPENYSANSAMKVWAAKFAARHPNIAILDLSSFKCGHDAPTYGIIDRIVEAAGVPYAALHDLDANKPGGSIKIRVRTYAYTLERRAEEIADTARKKLELDRRLVEKRREIEARHVRVQTTGQDDKVRHRPSDAAPGYVVDPATAAWLGEVERPTLVPLLRRQRAAATLEAVSAPEVTSWMDGTSSEGQPLLAHFETALIPMAPEVRRRQ
jgi:activator of 2-hydroxyglutaryl-CoA dehydratase/predicted nucleotide-binding protein (sugar kinase/HSP70/actin superfamily)